MHPVEEIPEVTRAASGKTTGRDVDAERILLTLVAHVTEIRDPQLVGLPFHPGGYLSGQVGAGPFDLLRRSVKNAGRTRDIKVTRTSCMGRCGEGPTVAVYPDGVWYRGVRPGDASEIVHEHLLQDRLVARLVDDVLQ